MGTHFDDAQDCDWRWRLQATLDVIISAGSRHDAVEDARLPPRIDVTALGVRPAPASLCRDTMQHAVDSDLRLPDAVDSPDRGYRRVLRDPLPKAEEEVVAHAPLHAKRGGLDDPSRVVPGETGLADSGRIRISGDHGERIEVDPAKAPSLARPARRLDTHASVQALQEPRPAPAQTQDQSRKQGTSVMM